MVWSTSRFRSWRGGSQSIDQQSGRRVLMEIRNGVLVGAGNSDVVWKTVRSGRRRSSSGRPSACLIRPPLPGPLSSHSSNFHSIPLPYFSWAWRNGISFFFFFFFRQYPPDLSIMVSKSPLPPPPPPPWVVALEKPLPKPPKSTANIPDPPGFSRSKTGGKQVCHLLLPTGLMPLYFCV